MFMISWYAFTKRLRTSVIARNETLAFCISSMTCGSSTPGTPRSNCVARSAARCCVWFTWSRPCFSTLENAFGGDCRAPPTPAAACEISAGGPPVPRTCDCMARIWASTASICTFDMGYSSDFDAGFAQLGELVAQGARADAETPGHRLAVTVVGAQRGQNQLALGGGNGFRKR